MSRVILVGLPLLLGLTPVHALQTLIELRPGMEVRVLAPSISSEYQHGIVVGILPGTLAFARGIDTTIVDHTAILRLDVRAKRRSALKGAIVFGGIALAVSPLAVAFTRLLACAYSACEAVGWREAGLLAGAMTVFYGGTGALLVLGWNASRPWYPVDRQQRTRAGGDMISLGVRIGI